MNKQTEGAQKRWSLVMVIPGVILTVLLAGAVVSTAQAAQLSFKVDQIQQQEHDLRLKQQFLEEKLASAQSLQAASAFAVAQGFTEQSHITAQLSTQSTLAELP